MVVLIHGVCDYSLSQWTIQLNELVILDTEKLPSLLGLLFWKLRDTKIQKLAKCCSAQVVPYSNPVLPKLVAVLC